MEERKNQLSLARACAELGQPLVLIGGVRDAGYLDACLRAGRGGVQHLGALEHGSTLLHSAYQACSLHVLASEFETPGLASLEAAALGARVVSTSRGSAREYLGDAAYYVEPDSVESIRAGIESALRDGGAVGALRRRVLERFTWRHAAEASLAVYRAVLQQARGRG